MNYDNVPKEELEELFLQQRYHHYELSEAMRKSRAVMAGMLR